MIPRKMGFQSAFEGGRCARLRNIPFDVPPRRNVAGMGFVCLRAEEDECIFDKGLRL
jgi:hypothetical protein